MHTAILGAGISGLTAGSELHRRGEEYTVCEEKSEIGGLCRVRTKEGFSLEVVSHVLHFQSPEAKQFLHTVLGGNLIQVERNAWIYFRGRYVPYPFQTHIGFLPLPEKVSCLLGYWRAWIGRQFGDQHHPENFEDWIHRHVGPGIARGFMVPYNTKLWGIAPRDMSVDWVRSFVPRSTMRECMLGFLLKESKQIGYNSSFLYPKRGGTQVLVDAIGAGVSNVRLNKRAVQIDLERKIVRFQDGDEVRYDRLISTIPLEVFILQAIGVPEELSYAATCLRFTAMLNLTFCLRRPAPNSFHWVYFPDPEFPFFRVVFPSNISSSLAPPGCSIVSVEISNPDMEKQEELERQVQQHLLDLGFIKHPSDVIFTERNYLDHAYPVHDLGREVRVKCLLDFLRSRDVWSIGRFGGWRYSSIDDAITEALRTVETITATPVGIAPPVSV